MKQSKQILSSRWFIAIISIVIGMLIVLAVRFFSYQPDLTHYHANFAVYINGERQKFEGSKYYEETAEMACTSEQIETPTARAHMHDNVSDVVHVEDNLVTWGNFMQNIGWGLGDDYLKTSEGLFVPDGTKTFTFVVNGQKVLGLANTVINDKDRVLISYGATTDDTAAQYASIEQTADIYNNKKDPAGCGSSRAITVDERFNNLFN